VLREPAKRVNRTGLASDRRSSEGEVRIGGFGGPDGLARWLGAHEVDAVVDAIHPFAEGISANAAHAAPVAGVPLLRLERPGWGERPGDRWTWVPDLDQAAAAIPQLGRRVLLTTGRQGLAPFAGIEEAWFLVRCVDPPDSPLPARHELLLDRGPYTLDGERSLVERHAIDLVVTKDSGGAHTEAKLDVARDLGLPVIVVRRPPRPDVPTEASVEAALRWARAQAG
jgi:precorrin-6A/cobalt-precorrin-6A reductase